MGHFPSVAPFIYRCLMPAPSTTSTSGNEPTLKLAINHHGFFPLVVGTATILRTGYSRALLQQV